MEGSGCTVTIV